MFSCCFGSPSPPTPPAPPQPCLDFTVVAPIPTLEQQKREDEEDLSFDAHARALRVDLALCTARSAWTERLANAAILLAEQSDSALVCILGATRGYGGHAVLVSLASAGSAAALLPVGELLPFPQVPAPVGQAGATCCVPLPPWEPPPALAQQQTDAQVARAFADEAWHRVLLGLQAACPPGKGSYPQQPQQVQPQWHAVLAPVCLGLRRVGALLLLLPSVAAPTAPVSPASGGDAPAARGHLLQPLLRWPAALECVAACVAECCLGPVLPAVEQACTYGELISTSPSLHDLSSTLTGAVAAIMSHELHVDVAVRLALLPYKDAPQGVLFEDTVAGSRHGGSQTHIPSLQSPGGGAGAGGATHLNNTPLVSASGLPYVPAMAGPGSMPLLYSGGAAAAGGGGGMSYLSIGAASGASAGAGRLHASHQGGPGNSHRDVRLLGTSPSAHGPTARAPSGINRLALLQAAVAGRAAVGTASDSTEVLLVPASHGSATEGHITWAPGGGGTGGGGTGSGTGNSSGIMGVRSRRRVGGRGQIKASTFTLASTLAAALLATPAPAAAPPVSTPRRNSIPGGVAVRGYATGGGGGGAAGGGGSGNASLHLAGAVIASVAAYLQDADQPTADAFLIFRSGGRGGGGGGGGPAGFSGGAGTGPASMVAVAGWYGAASGGPGAPSLPSPGPGTAPPRPLLPSLHAPRAAPVLAGIGGIGGGGGGGGSIALLPASGGHTSSCHLLGGMDAFGSTGGTSAPAFVLYLTSALPLPPALLSAVRERSMSLLEVLLPAAARALMGPVQDEWGYLCAQTGAGTGTTQAMHASATTFNSGAAGNSGILGDDGGGGGGGTGGSAGPFGGRFSGIGAVAVAATVRGGGGSGRSQPSTGTGMNANPAPAAGSNSDLFPSSPHGRHNTDLPSQTNSTILEHTSTKNSGSVPALPASPAGPSTIFMRTSAAAAAALSHASISRHGIVVAAGAAVAATGAAGSGGMPSMLLSPRVSGDAAIAAAAAAAGAGGGALHGSTGLLPTCRRPSPTSPAHLPPGSAGAAGSGKRGSNLDTVLDTAASFFSTAGLTAMQFDDDGNLLLMGTGLGAGGTGTGGGVGFLSTVLSDGREAAKEARHAELNIMVSTFHAALARVRHDTNTLGGAHAEDDIRSLRLLKTIGTGGCSVVLLGRLHAMPVAVKVILPHTDEEEDDTGAGGSGGASTQQQPPKPPRPGGGGGGDGGGGGGGGGGASSAMSGLAGAWARPSPAARQLRLRMMMRGARELAVMTSISHPNIVQVYSYCTRVAVRQIPNAIPQLTVVSEGALATSPLCTALIMEYCDMGSLADAIDTGAFARAARSAATALHNAVKARGAQSAAMGRADRGALLGAGGSSSTTTAAAAAATTTISGPHVIGGGGNTGSNSAAAWTARDNGTLASPAPVAAAAAAVGGAGGATSSVSGSGGSGGGGSSSGGGGDSRARNSVGMVTTAVAATAGTPAMRAVYLTLLEVALALRHLHSLQLVHCDVKPANVLLRSSATDPRGFTAKLTDFGFVNLLEQEQGAESDSAGGRPDHSGGSTGGVNRATLKFHEPIGTVTHMAPELFVKGNVMDSSIDVYAFGILMWEMATGRAPYPEYAEAQFMEVPYKVVKEGLRPRFPSDTPLHFKLLAQECWASQPIRRPTTAGLVMRLQRLLDLCCGLVQPGPGGV